MQSKMTVVPDAHIFTTRDNRCAIAAYAQAVDG